MGGRDQDFPQGPALAHIGDLEPLLQKGHRPRRGGGVRLDSSKENPTGQCGHGEPDLAAGPLVNAYLLAGAGSCGRIWTTRVAPVLNPKLAAAARATGAGDELAHPPGAVQSRGSTVPGSCRPRTPFVGSRADGSASHGCRAHTRSHVQMRPSQRLSEAQLGRHVSGAHEGSREFEGRSQEVSPRARLGLSERVSWLFDYGRWIYWLWLT